MITTHLCRNAGDAAEKAGLFLGKLLSQKPVLFLSSGGSSLSILSYLRSLRDLVASVLDERGDNLANLQKTKFFQNAKPMDLTEKNLRDWRGRIVITLGIGPDGHTAGIMPFPEDPQKFQKLFDDPDHWVVSYDAAEKNAYPNRTTVTLPFLRRVDHAVVFVCGKEKQRALEKTLAQKGSLPQTPARIIREMGKIDLFTDIDLSG